MDHIVQFNRKPRSTGKSILLSLLLFWIAGWEHHDEEVKEPEAVPACAYSPEGFFLSEDGRIHYEDDTWVSRQVVDVSSYQKEINWQQAASDGIDMAIIRLGYLARDIQLAATEQKGLFHTHHPVSIR